MKLEGDYIFNGPREEVWQLVRDPEMLSTALPGTQSLNKVNDNEYEGTMNVRVGPVSGAFSGRLLVSNEVPPESYTLTVEGKGAQGFATGTGHVRLTDQGDGTTLMKYEGDVQIGGKLASVGQRMVETVSKSMARQGLDALNKALEARMAAQAAGREVEYVPPSEAEFATAVAKDMGRNVMASTEVRLLLYVIPMGVILAVVAFLLSRCS